MSELSFTNNSRRSFTEKKFKASNLVVIFMQFRQAEMQTFFLFMISRSSPWYLWMCLFVKASCLIHRDIQKHHLLFIICRSLSWRSCKCLLTQFLLGTKFFHENVKNKFEVLLKLSCYSSTRQYENFAIGVNKFFFQFLHVESQLSHENQDGILLTL